MFNPKVVALIGASEREGTVGCALMKNLLLGKDRIKIYPINPNRPTILGIKTYPSIDAVPEHVDLAVVATPAKTVPGVVDECGKAGVSGAVVISAGFSEAGPDGKKLEDETKAICAQYKMRLMGPNCVGFVRPTTSLNATFLRDNPSPGSIAFISQSGALGSAILNWAIGSNVGFSFFASVGAMVDIQFGDLIDYLGEDPMTKSIIIYMESIGSAKRFMSAARGFARTKPIIVLKAGKYNTGAKAAMSHTGSMAGDFEVYDAAFKRVGVVRVNEISDLFDCAAVLGAKQLPAGPRIAVITNAGGPGVMASDFITDWGVEMAKLTPESVQILDQMLPSYWSHGNPVDVLGDADVKRYEAALQVCINDPNVDGVLAVYTPVAISPPTEIADAVLRVKALAQKPLLTVWMGEEGVREARKKFRAGNVPTYETPEEAVKAYTFMYRYNRNLELLYQTPAELPVNIAPPKSHLEVVIRKASKEGRTLLSQVDADRFLDVYGIRRLEGGLATSPDEAAEIARNVGYPVVLKIMSQDIVHKTDIGGVVVGIGSREQLADEYRKMMDRVRTAKPDARIDGVYVQKMAPKIDYELILGAKRDRDFGEVVLFGMGGIGVELFRDFSVGLPPLNQVLAKRMIEETRIYKALSKGLRDKAPVDLLTVEESVVRFSNLIADFPEIVEMDINPLIVSGQKLYAADARILLDLTTPRPTQAYSHLVIVPYPTKYVIPWVMNDGREVTLRPIRPEDEPMEHEFVKGLSEETSRRRFFSVIKDMSHDSLVRFCNIDYDREMAFVAEVRENGKRVEIAVGRLIMEPRENRGEFAVVVADRYQDQGLGTKLVDMLIGVAEEKGLESIYGLVLPENIEMITVCENLGFKVSRQEDNMFVELKLSAAPSERVVAAASRPAPVLEAEELEEQ
ncbi:MAG TPA: GNAT family N-acetyltransferase [Nitrososphaerales archaeon]|nr:GNAT family N-acetyltransferase [Nitrososphaerales archaeon]